MHATCIDPFGINPVKKRLVERIERAETSIGCEESSGRSSTYPSECPEFIACCCVPKPAAGMHGGACDVEGRSMRQQQPAMRWCHLTGACFGPTPAAGMHGDVMSQSPITNY
jgi:hypothetical protein